MAGIELLPALAERASDPAYGVPLPFACEHEDGGGVRALNRGRVLQCALSRICGLCGASLEWPVAFLGSPEEADRNGFWFPPLHTACAAAALATYPPLGVPVLGQDRPLPEWALVVTGGFELERPGRRDGDRRPVFHPNAITEDRRIPG